MELKGGSSARKRQGIKCQRLGDGEVGSVGRTGATTGSGGLLFLKLNVGSNLLSQSEASLLQAIDQRPLLAMVRAQHLEPATKIGSILPRGKISEIAEDDHRLVVPLR